MQEELYWQHRRSLSWLIGLLRGTRLGPTFFAIANGRRRSCSILRLCIHGEVAADSEIIKHHIFSFFSDVLGAKRPAVVRISSDLWALNEMVSADDNLLLLIPLSHDETDLVVSSSISKSAPEPDGFSISIFKKFLPVLKFLVYAIITGFRLGMVDISD